MVELVTPRYHETNRTVISLKTLLLFLGVALKKTEVDPHF